MQSLEAIVVNATELRRDLHKILGRVAREQVPVVVTSRGKPVATLLKFSSSANVRFRQAKKGRRRRTPATGTPQP